MTRPAQRALDLPRSGIRAIMDVASGIPDAIHLEVGEPDFPTPPHVVEAAGEAARAGYTRYTASRGYPSLRDAIVTRLAQRNGITATIDQVTVTSGAVTALFEGFLAILEPGDVVLVPDPGWPNTEAMVTLAGGRAERYPLVADEGFEPDLDVMRSLAALHRPKAIYVNSPSNPTGAVFSRATIEAICDLAAATGAYLVSDECYEAITFDQPHISPATILPDRCLTAFSFSKTYAMTGWRVGYLVAPPDVSDVVVKLQEPVISCASAVSQKAAEAALTGPQDVVGTMVDEYRRRRDEIVATLARAGLLASRPAGAFYVMADVSASGRSGREFALELIAQRAVAVAPGDTFGPAGTHLVRMSLASSIDALREGTARLIAQVTERRTQLDREAPR